MGARGDADDTYATGGAAVAEGEDRIGVVAAVGVVLLALLTVSVVVLTREDGDPAEAGETEAPPDRRPTPPEELAQLWAAPAVLAPVTGAGADVIRVWPHDGTVTVVTAGAVRGYRTVDGRETWDADAPPGAGAPCAAAPRANAAGEGAVLYEDADGGCSVLALVDGERGELRWWRQLAAGDEPVGAAGVTVAVGRETVSVGLSGDGAPQAFHRLAVADGATSPLPRPPERAEAECRPELRQPVTVRQRGNRLLVLSQCRGAPGTRELSVHDADSGAWEWSHETAPGAELDLREVVAGDPVVLVEGRGAEAGLVAYGETGQELWRLPLGSTGEETADEETADERPQDGNGNGGGGGEREPTPGPLPGAHSVVAGEVLVTRYQPAPDAEVPADIWLLAGYELATGERRWTVELAADTQPLGLNEVGEPLLAEPTEGDRLRVRTLDPATGEISTDGSVALSPDRAYDHQFAAFDENQLYLLTAMAAPTPKLRLHAYER
ncbi:PQQ-binding-like beta-propeller repeat protein [Streptomyces sedi]|uniref:PQQ-binding-like beta-propeller repeat protein n=1 Tax=Streptomyces sedi TaxID=555059 RepID=A0A5C4V8Z3_9ACTN|nr:PQQ-binding-like beta-propeller repeat protein [Streptomyces sedi]TNM32353.1 hypothetical protein FH715_08255 [Streptomyces sedi]